MIVGHTPSHSRTGAAMKAFTALASLLLAVTASACASTGMSDADKLATYRAHAGAPVDSFRYFGSINGWTSLGDTAVAVWTRPSEAWLLELTGPCPDIEYAPMIGVTSQRSEEHTSELQSLMRISYAVFCLKKKKKNIKRQ